MNIAGAAAIVTGGASGLGEATARTLAARGAKVAVLDLQEERGREVAARIGGVFARCDVTDDASVSAALAAASAAHGPARIAVTCAGIVAGRRVVGRGNAPHPMEEFARVVAVNLLGTMRVLSQAAAAMAPLEPDAIGARGVIVTTGSIAAEDGQIGQTAYAASKAGVAGLTLPAARELASHGIRVVCIMPGVFDTPMMAGLGEDVRAALAATIPFPPRLGDPADFAALAVHAVENDTLNGSAIRLDGALRMAAR
jgi:NAD(P)-dependent dehydrogenase (short-subunit alcohol dehydrogenase family)